MVRGGKSVTRVLDMLAVEKGGGVGETDAAGNVRSINNNATTILYDQENRILTDAGVTYTYNGDGERVAKSSGELYWGKGPLAQPSAGRIMKVGAPSFAFIAKGGRQTDRTVGFSFHAVRASNEIFPQPSFTRTGPSSSRR